MLSDDPIGQRQIIQTGIAEYPIVIAPNDKGVWQFTATTVDRINYLDEHFADIAPVAGHDWLRDLFPTSMTTTKFLLPTYQWICLFIYNFRRHHPRLYFPGRALPTYAELAQVQKARSQRFNQQHFMETGWSAGARQHMVQRYMPAGSATEPA